LDDLHRRLDGTRWPEAETVGDWSQGVPLAQAQALCAYWRNGYDWRRCEAMLNGFGQYRTEIDSLGVHFLHIRSPEAEAAPLLITHGWPGSVIEFHKVIGPLSNPGAHRGDAADAFHLVIPSLPGYGFSDKPARAGWNISRTAKAWIILMQRLGYDRYYAQGGDWGGAVTSEIGNLAPDACAAIHLNMPVGFPTEAEKRNMTSQEVAATAALENYNAAESGYAKQQSTRPQTIGYALTDSPVGQASWIFEKFRAWTDSDGNPLSILSYDAILDNIMLYWLPATGAAAGRFYWENAARTFQRRTVQTRTGCTLFPKEIYRPSRRWAERSYPQLIYWNEAEHGGHFAAFEQPDIFVQEVRNCFRVVRRK
jgi:pimeloyl-ACP methyl ester carboxylesterase